MEFKSAFEGAGWVLVVVGGFYIGDIRCWLGFGGRCWMFNRFPKKLDGCWWMLVDYKTVS